MRPYTLFKDFAGKSRACHAALSAAGRTQGCLAAWTVWAQPPQHACTQPLAHLPWVYILVGGGVSSTLFLTAMAERVREIRQSALEAEKLGKDHASLQECIALLEAQWANWEDPVDKGVGEQVDKGVGKEKVPEEALEYEKETLEAEVFNRINEAIFIHSAQVTDAE